MVAGEPRWLASLDPGIRPALSALHAEGIDFRVLRRRRRSWFAQPTARFYGEPGEGFLALALAVQRGPRAQELRRYWQVNRAGEREDPDWELAFA
jgi:hypothetical protein